MEFDELEELRKRLEYNSELEDEEIEKLWGLIDEAIARQSEMKFDELISNGQLTKAARLFAKEYYDSGRMGHTRKLLIERLADKCDKYDAEIARQSATSKEVQRAINVLATTREGHDVFTFYKSNKVKRAIDLAITALKEYQPWVSVEDRLPADGTPVLTTYVGFYDGKLYSDGVAKRSIEENSYKGGWLWELGGSEVAVEITHWKPLPEPPNQMRKEKTVCSQPKNPPRENKK